MIALERKKQPEYKSNGVQIAHAKKSLPFAASTAGIYAHRVRSVDMITMLGESHLAVACWCGMTLLVSTRKKTKLYEEVPDGRPMCATCEGRVIGKDSGKINGLDVRYKPRVQANARIEPGRCE